MPLTPVRIAAAIFAAVAALWAVPRLLPVAFIAVLMVVFGLLLDAAVAPLSRHMPRPAATLIVLVVAAGVLAGVVVLVVPAVVGEFHALAAAHGDLRQLIVDQINALSGHLPFDVPVLDADDINAGLYQTLVADTTALRSGLTAVMVLAVALFGGIWVVAYPEAIRDRLLAFVPEDRQARTIEVVGHVTHRLRRWLAGQLVLMVAVGAGSYVVFRSVGVPFAALFAVAAGLLEAVPTIGFIIAAVPPTLLVLVTDPVDAVWLLAGLVLVQQLQDRLLVPVVMRRAVALPEALTLLVLLSFGALFGPAGMVVAIPVTAAFLTVHDELRGGPEQLRRRRSPEGPDGDVSELASGNS